MRQKLSDDRWAAIQRLTNEEYRVFLALGEGRSGTEIAGDQQKSRKTVETQIARIKEKLNLRSIPLVIVHSSRFQMFFGQPRLETKSERFFVIEK